MVREVFRISQLQLPPIPPVIGRTLPKCREALDGEGMICWQQGWGHMLLEAAFILRNE